MESKRTTEDRIWAVLSHLSALALGMGILLPVIGWSEQRRKSKYAAFQCLQALGYQSLGFTVWLLAYLLIFIVFMVLFAFMLGAPGNGSRLISYWTSIFVLLAFSSFGIYILLPVIAAVMCAFGRDFRYPLLGNRLAKYLGYEQPASEDSSWLIEDHEDRWVAAMGHFSVIIALWGILAPIAAWVVQGKRAAFIRFQSVQTVIYQLIVNVLYMGSGIIAFVGTIPLFALTGLEGNSTLNSPVSMAGLGLFVVSLLCASIMLLVLPLFHILGQWAGYRVLKGDDYHYPVIGRLVENRMSRNSSQKEITS